MARFQRLQRLHKNEAAHAISEAHRKPARVNLDALDRPRIDRTENTLVITDMERVKQWMAVQHDADLGVFTAAKMCPRRNATRCGTGQALRDT